MAYFIRTFRYIGYFIMIYNVFVSLPESDEPYLFLRLNTCLLPCQSLMNYIFVPDPLFASLAESGELYLGS